MAASESKAVKEAVCLSQTSSRRSWKEKECSPRRGVGERSRRLKFDPFDSSYLGADALN